MFQINIVSFLMLKSFTILFLDVIASSVIWKYIILTNKYSQDLFKMFSKFHIQHFFSSYLYMSYLFCLYIKKHDTISLYMNPFYKNYNVKINKNIRIYWANWSRSKSKWLGNRYKGDLCGRKSRIFDVRISRISWNAYFDTHVILIQKLVIPAMYFFCASILLLLLFFFYFCCCCFCCCCYFISMSDDWLSDILKITKKRLTTIMPKISFLFFCFSLLN